MTECEMIVSVDDIILFYNDVNDNSNNLLEQPAGSKDHKQQKKKFIIEFLKAKQREEDVTLIEIIETIPGLIFDSTKKQLIQFLKEDDFEEFKVFLLQS